MRSHWRRTLITAGILGVAFAAPTATVTAHAATSGPKQTATYPVSKGTLVAGGETLSATYDSEISKTKSTFKVFIGNPSGNQVPGTTGFSSSSGGLGGGTTDTITWQAASGLATGSYAAVIHVERVNSDGTSDPAEDTDTTSTFFVDGSAPSQLAPPTVINNTNDTAAPFTGQGPAGTTVTVTVSGTTSPGLPATATGSGVVAPCGTAQCPWTVNVDVSNLDDGNLSWTAQAKDSGGTSTSAAQGPGVLKDTTAPDQPTNVQASIPQGSTTMTISADDDSSDVDHWLVSSTDQGGHNSKATVDDDDSLSATVDVGGLDDGTLTVDLQAADAHGNVSTAAEVMVTKDTGISVDFDAGSVVAGGKSVAFPTVAQRPVGPLTQVMVAFTEPIQQSYQDNSQSPAGNGPTTRSTLCVSLVGGNGTCLNNAATVPTDHDRTLVADLPNKLNDGSYSVSYVAYPKYFCPDITLGGSKNADCVASTGTVQVPNSGDNLTITIDSTPPSITITQVPNEVTGGNVTHVTLGGDVSTDTVSVAVAVRSNGGGQTKTATAAIASPQSGASTTTWSITMDLSSLANGKLTIAAAAKDANNNTAAAAATTLKQVRVPVTLTFTTPKGHAPKTSPMRLKGKVSPKLSGKTVHFYRKTSHGKKQIGTDKLNHHSRWNLEVKLPHHKVRIYATIHQTAQTLAGRSGNLVVRVKH